MSQKYTDARYPEKINDLIDNEGNVNPEIIPPAPTPEPGLKLYKHTILLREYDYGEEGPGVFISGYNQPFTSKEDLSAHQDMLLPCRNKDSSWLYLGIIDNVMLGVCGNQLDSYSLDDTDFILDTVEELQN